MFFRIALLLLGVYACSTAVIFIKATPIDAALLAGYRQLVAAAALTPLFLRDLRRCPGRFGGRELRSAVLPGLLLGAHFITWIIGVHKTPAANASLIVNMVPVAMPFLMFALVGERLSRGEAAGTLVALAGVAVMSAWDLKLSSAYFAGDAMCFASMLLFALYLALGRRNQTVPTVWLYVVPVYWIGGAACLLAAVTHVNPLQPYSGLDVAMILALGIVPTVVGHSILNYSIKHLRGQVVSVLNLLQFVFAAVMALFIYNEVPDWATYVAGAALVAGSVIVLRARQGHEAAAAPAGRTAPSPGQPEPQ